MKSLKGLATGIGSLPYNNAEEALELIFRYVPNIPFWPQLPKRDLREGMIVQFSEHLPCLEFESGKLIFNDSNKEKELEVFYDKVISLDINYFKISPEFSLGLHKFCQRLENSDLSNVDFIKCHITGPFTFAAGVNDRQGNCLLHDEIFMQALAKGLGMKALWQLQTFKKFGKKMIILLDEPYLGCVGSAYTPVNREDVINVLSDMAEAIKAEPCLIGVHCCGNTDWSMLMDSKGVDIISFDAFNFQERFVLYADKLKSFIQRGGIICWGIVPTQDNIGKLTAQILADKIASGLDILVKKGLSRQLLLENSIISPACGLGALSCEDSASIFGLLSETSRFIAKNL